MRIKLPALGEKRASPVDRTVAALTRILGAVELDPELVPEHWLDTEGPSFAIYVDSQRGERPTWSPREAGKIARAAVQLLAMRRELNQLALSQGYPRVVTETQALTLAACPDCYELQLIGPGSGRRGYECQVCPTSCRQKHRGNQINCEECRVQMVPIWTTKDPIPEDWLI